MGNKSDRPTGSAPRPKVVQENEQFYHVRIRHEDEFTEFRTPIGTEAAPTSPIVEGCDVREGRLGPDTWVVQCVLLPVDAANGRAEAEMLAERVVDRLES